MQLRQGEESYDGAQVEGWEWEERARQSLGPQRWEHSSDGDGDDSEGETGGKGGGGDRLQAYEVEWVDGRPKYLRAVEVAQRA